MLFAVLLGVLVGSALACRPLNATSPCVYTKWNGTLPFAASAAFPTGGVTLPVRWTIDTLAGASGVTNAIVGRQLGVLNTHFSKFGVRFRTHSIVRIRYGVCDFDAILHDIVNPNLPVISIVLCDMESLGLAGGNLMILNPSTLPGAPGDYNTGKTAVHEMGHIFGLAHVFEGKTCNRDGDGVRDTPFQKTETFGCPTRKDSCPSRPGLDSINNFMDYSDDRCLTRFTNGQINKMRAVIATHKTKLWATSQPPYSLNGLTFFLKLVGRNACPVRGYLQAYEDCDVGYMTLTPDLEQGFAEWKAFDGDWNSRVWLSNVNRFAWQCDEALTSWYDDGYYWPVMSMDFTPRWKFEWRGQNTVRIKDVYENMYLGMTSDCDYDTVELVALGDGALIDWKIQRNV